MIWNKIKEKGSYRGAKLFNDSMPLTKNYVFKAFLVPLVGFPLCSLWLMWSMIP